MKASILASILLAIPFLLMGSSSALTTGGDPPADDGSAERGACMNEFQGYLDQCVNFFPGMAEPDTNADARQACMDEARDALDMCLGAIPAPPNKPKRSDCIAEGRARIASCASANSGDTPAKKMARTNCFAGARAATQQCLATSIPG